jgi:hypothetical protein
MRRCSVTSRKLHTRPTISPSTRCGRERFEAATVGELHRLRALLLGLRVQLLDPLAERLGVRQAILDVGEQRAVVLAVDQSLGNLPELEKPLVPGHDLAVEVDDEDPVRGGVERGLQQRLLDAPSAIRPRQQDERALAVGGLPRPPADSNGGPLIGFGDDGFGSLENVLDAGPLREEVSQATPGQIGRAHQFTGTVVGVQHPSVAVQQQRGVGTPVHDRCVRDLKLARALRSRRHLVVSTHGLAPPNVSPTYSKSSGMGTSRSRSFSK